MIKTISRLSAVLGILVLPVCFAARSEPPTAQIQGTEYSVSVGDSTLRTSERLILAADDQDKKKQKEREDLKKKQMAEHQAREELRKKEMAERRAKEEQKRKEMAEHRAKEQERERERRKERAEHRGGDEHKAAGNVAPQTFAPPPPPPSVPRQGFAPPQQAAPAVPATPKQGFSAPQQAAPAIPVAPKQEVVAPQTPAPAPVATAAPASPLVVRTYPASGVRGGSAPGAVLNAYTSFPDKSGRVWFEWGDSPSFGQSTNAEAFKGEKSVGQFTYVPAAKKKYFYRAIAEGSGFLVYGETQSFVVP